MSPGAPFRLDGAGARGNDAGVCVDVRILDGGQAEGLDVAAGEADGENGLGGVQSLGEELGGERERAEVLEHVGGQFMF